MHTHRCVLLYEYMHLFVCVCEHVCVFNYSSSTVSSTIGFGALIKKHWGNGLWACCVALALGLTKTHKELPVAGTIDCIELGPKDRQLSRYRNPSEKTLGYPVLMSKEKKGIQCAQYLYITLTTQIWSNVIETMTSSQVPTGYPLQWQKNKQSHLGQNTVPCPLATDPCIFVSMRLWHSLWPLKYSWTAAFPISALLRLCRACTDSL